MYVKESIIKATSMGFHCGSKRSSYKTNKESPLCHLHWVENEISTTHFRKIHCILVFSVGFLC